MHSFTMTLAEPSAGAGMNLKMTNRIHQAIYMMALLILAVALTTALVVAAERSSESQKKAMSQVKGLVAPDAGERGPMGCV
jgi:hypothetical protein